MFVTIKNWDKYNKRKDIKKPWWFALNNRLLEDPDLFSLSHSEIVAFIYILCQASQKQCGKVQINVDHAHRVSNLHKRDLLSAIKKLQESKILIMDPYVICTESVRDPTSTLHYKTEPYRTEQDITEQNIAQNALSVSEFEQVYEIYPRKVGKSRGLEKLRSQIKSKEDLGKSIQAVKRFKEYHEGKGTEQQFIPHFSTWVSSWRDWLDPETGSSTIQNPSVQMVNGFRVTRANLDDL